MSATMLLSMVANVRRALTRVVYARAVLLALGVALSAWLVVDGDAELVFDADFAAKWQRALDRLGSKGGPDGRFDLASFSHQTGRA